MLWVSRPTGSVQIDVPEFSAYRAVWSNFMYQARRPRAPGR
jgi:hypothetical protein